MFEIGGTLGLWTFLSAPRKLGERKYVRCRCACGIEKEVQLVSLAGGTSSGCKSCKKATHGHSIRLALGRRATPTYSSWLNMTRRCKPGYAESHLYFDKGVRVCERWEIFENFLADMGERPLRTSLDRYPDGDGNYELGNCRWATAKQQGRNRFDVKLSEEKVKEIRSLQGIVRAADLADRYGVAKATIYNIFNHRIWAEE